MLPAKRREMDGSPAAEGSPQCPMSSPGLGVKIALRSALGHSRKGDLGLLRASGLPPSIERPSRALCWQRRCRSPRLKSNPTRHETISSPSRDGPHRHTRARQIDYLEVRRLVRSLSSKSALLSASTGTLLKRTTRFWSLSMTTRHVDSPSLPFNPPSPLTNAQPRCGLRI